MGVPDPADGFSPHRIHTMTSPRADALREARFLPPDARSAAHRPPVHEVSAQTNSVML
jgi:hypothetical protein